jgi:hypothetical protein
MYVCMHAFASTSNACSSANDVAERTSPMYVCVCVYVCMYVCMSLQIKDTPMSCDIIFSGHTYIHTCKVLSRIFFILLTYTHTHIHTCKVCSSVPLSLFLCYCRDGVQHTHTHTHTYMHIYIPARSAPVYPSVCFCATAGMVSQTSSSSLPVLRSFRMCISKI